MIEDTEPFEQPTIGRRQEPIVQSLAEELIHHIKAGDGITATCRFMEWLGTLDQAALLLRQAGESAIYRLSATASIKEMRNLTNAAIGGERIVVDIVRDRLR